MEHGQLQVLRPEVVPPLRDAMCLVDGEQRDLRAAQQIQHSLGHQALGRYIEQVQLSGQKCLFNAARLVNLQGRVQKSRTGSDLAQGGDLILHQGDQWRYDQSRPGAKNGRDLKAKGLAATGGHQHQRVTALEQGAHDLFLARPKTIVAKYTA